MSIEQGRKLLAFAVAAAVGATEARALAERPALPQCTARLVVGNPRYRGSAAPNPAGQGATEDPPVQIRGMAVQNGDLHAHTLYELWMIPAAAKPGKIVRYAGDGKAESERYSFRDGPCAEARFPQISGVAAGANGAIIVTDRLANAVVSIESPGQPGCTAKILAGPGAAATIPSAGLGPGDKDGEGASARFLSPSHPAVDEKGNVYVVDNKNKVKQIATDAAHTVTTVAVLPADSGYTYSAMTYMNGSLYVTYLQMLKNSVLAVDPASGKTRALLEGNGKVYPPLDSSVVPGLGAITNNGTQLFITGRGLVWSLTPSGTLVLVAGNGKYEFDQRTDFAATHPALSLPLEGNATNVDMAFLPGSGLLFRGRAGYSNNSYVLQIACP